MPDSLLRLGMMLAICIASIMPLTAAPYPSDGLVIDWIQPDGTPLKLRVFGDEFYARSTTDEGYTILFDSKSNAYYYATIGADGKSLAASDVLAHRAAPGDLAKHLEQPKEISAEIRAANVARLVPDRAANWAARVKAVQHQRERKANPAPAEDITGAAPAEQALAAPISGSKVGLMILVSFPNDPNTVGSDPISFPTTQAKIQRYCNQVGYADDGNTGSIRDYFYDQSWGGLTFTHVVTSIVTLTHPRNYYNYSDYPANATRQDFVTAGRMLIGDAITSLKASGFDFTSLTVDSSNRVISTSLLFAGANSGVWSQGLWPHSSSLSTQINVGTAASPRYIYSYQATNVATAAVPIGTNCHELGHLLMGYPDLYDADPGDGDSRGLGEHCLMSRGNYVNNELTPAPIDLYLKDYSGWATITDLLYTESLTATLPATGNRGYRIRKSGTPTEYFLVENRGAPDKWAASVPDRGIMIWHVDEAVTTGNQRQQMTTASHYTVSLEQADGQFNLENNIGDGDAADLFDNTTPAFNNSTVPDAKWWSGGASGIRINVLSAVGPSMDVHFGFATPQSSVWVDFSYSGWTQDGSYGFPYRSMAAGVFGVTSGGTISIKPSVTSETITIGKPMLLQAVSGPAIIGR